uniref:Pyridine nucleotide-disulfide oxidoreductase domain-containing protein 1 n=1 Tax=Romanomermis culicivorax TaxID=13658 RepID=A0A915ITQ8_ROMCU
MRYVVVGGGIAAVSCVEELSSLDSESEIVLISASKVVKAVSNVRQTGHVMEEFDVVEKAAEDLSTKRNNVSVIFDYCCRIDSDRSEVHMKNGLILKYDKICLATGGRPKLISDSEFVVGIRDTESVQSFQEKLKGCKRIMVVGNGGIASELIYELKNVEIIWAIKHKSIIATFIDAGAAQFLLSHMNNEPCSSGDIETVSKRWKYSHAPAPIEPQISFSTHGSALGPDWVNNVNATGCQQVPKNVHVEYECEVDHVIDSEQFLNENRNDESLLNTSLELERRNWKAYVRLTNGKVYGCDLLVSATGVSPNNCIPVVGHEVLCLADDGGVMVNDQMETSVKGVYAAGDLCTASWKWYPHWIQMRLWTQAKQMGLYAGKCMWLNQQEKKADLDLCFEIFTHVTKFFGFKIVLLGLFNSQTLRPDHEAHVREEYVKVLIQDGKVQGAILIGETDLEETMENLILNETDVTGLNLLDPSIDIEDYFD